VTAILDPDQMVEDRTIWPAIASLTACLCRTVVDLGLPPVCICSPMPGEEIASDYVSEEAGMAWVRLESAWPSTNFPSPSGAAACNAPLAFGIEVGLAYCAPGSSDDGEPPSMAAQFDAVRLQMAAMNAMRQAILCCFPTSRASDVALGVYVPAGPQGGVVGGTWSISVAEGAVARGTQG
jgi:hypothetical protein